MSHKLPISDVRPTQLYISREKLAGVLEWFDVDTVEYEPLPAFEHDGSWYLSDGHTRAFAAYLAGEDTLRIRRDGEVREEYDFELYLQCMEWCEEAGVTTVADFRGRLLEPDTYQQQWIDRCDRAAVGADGSVTDRSTSGRNGSQK